MKVTYNWLKDFVKIKIPAQALADKLTMAGLEVTSLEEKEGDFVLEIEITSNRPDLLSVIGIAREIAAITNSKLKFPPSKAKLLKAKSAKHFTSCEQAFSINIEDKKDCPLYTVKIIKDLKVGPSPGWLKQRLELVGSRSVNNVVDITNYILFEWGEPLHAFDLDKLDPGAIFVRRSIKGEKITTIDAERRILNPDILVIADKGRAVAIAGIMGGKDTEVTEDTKNILLEAAIFNPLIVRRARQNLGLQSESAYRFERGVYLDIVQGASCHATQLILELCGGRCVQAKESKVMPRKNTKINLDGSAIHRILGISIDNLQIKNILNKLEFEVKLKTNKHFIVEVPAHRQDVKLEIDLIEEIARIYGFERIPTTAPRVSPRIIGSKERGPISSIKNILVGLGLNEVITYSLLDRGSLKYFWSQTDNIIDILNPLSEEQEILRPMLISSLSSCVANNLRQKQTVINIFEIAKTYVNTDEKIQEQYTLGIALCGTKSRWFGIKNGYIQDEAEFLHLKGILEALFKRLGISEKEYKFIPEGNGQEFKVQVKGDNVGIVKRLSREILDRLDIKNKGVFAAEITLDKLLSFAQLKKQFKAFPRYPGISRDITLELREEVSLEQVQNLILHIGGGLLLTSEFVAYFKGKQVPNGFKRLTVSCRYGSPQRTLTEAEVNPLHENVVRELQGKFKAKIC